MSGVIGSDLERVGAPEKIMGSTRFGADDTRRELAYAVLATATIGKGRITSLHTRAAAEMPGVLLVLTHESMDRLQSPGFVFGGGYGFQSLALMQSDRVAYRGQPIALVVADSLETATEAAGLVRAEYAEEPFSVTLDAPGGETVRQSDAVPLPAFADKTIGDADTRLGTADVVVDAEYVSPPQHQNPMELLSTVAEWRAGALTIHESTQNTEALRFGVSQQLGIDPSNVRVVSSYAGGAFGQRNSLGPHTTFAAVAARHLGRPVKIVMTRQQIFHGASFRPATIQRIQLGAQRNGRMLALIHRTWQQTSRHDDFVTLGAEATARLYDVPNLRTENHLVRTDVQTPGFMRTPWEHVAAFALESAVDELAYALQLDPVELRLANDAQLDPLTGKPFSSRRVADCLRRGAARFGWSGRNPQPGSMRAANGDLLGWGVAIGAYPGALLPTTAGVRLYRDGSVEVDVSGHELGQGLRSVVAAVVADRLDVDPAAVSITMGDTRVPPQQLTAGAWGTASVGPAVYDACNQVRALDRAGREFVEATVTRLGQGQTAEALEPARHGLVASAGPEYPDFVNFQFVAHFIEVAIDSLTYQVRVPRAVSVVDCGRVVSARTARSQVLGGLVWGIGAALREVSEVDPRFGGFHNANIAEYHVAVNADIGDFTVEFIDEPDFTFNPLGAKGLGEVVMAGVAPAVANAIYHATGRRFRSLPIRLDDLHTTPPLTV